MTIIENIIALWNRIERLVKPDVDAIIKAFLKAQTKLGNLIDRELQQTRKETEAIEDAYGYISKLMTSRDARNEVINRAYRVIHKLDELTA